MSTKINTDYVVIKKLTLPEGGLKMSSLPIDDTSKVFARSFATAQTKVDRFAATAQTEVDRLAATAQTKYGMQPSHTDVSDFWNNFEPNSETVDSDEMSQEINPNVQAIFDARDGIGSAGPSYVDDGRIGPWELRAAGITDASSNKLLRQFGNRDGFLDVAEFQQLVDKGIIEFPSDSSSKQAIQITPKGQHLLTTFGTNDTNHNGVISKDEYVTGVSEEVGNNDQDFLDFLGGKYDQLDADKSGTLSLTEYEPFSSKVEPTDGGPEADFLASFDKDGDGRVSVKEHKEGHGGDVTGTVDTDGDGFVSLEEHKKYHSHTDTDHTDHTDTDHTDTDTDHMDTDDTHTDM